METSGSSRCVGMWGGGGQGRWLFMRFKERRGIKGPSHHSQLKLSLIEEIQPQMWLWIPINRFCAPNQRRCAFWKVSRGELWKCIEAPWTDSWPWFVYSTFPLNKTWTDSRSVGPEILQFNDWVSSLYTPPKLYIISSLSHSPPAICRTISRLCVLYSKTFLRRSSTQGLFSFFSSTFYIVFRCEWLFLCGHSIKGGCCKFCQI